MEFIFWLGSWTRQNDIIISESDTGSDDHKRVTSRKRYIILVRGEGLPEEVTLEQKPK